MTLKINGREYTYEGDNNMPLLWVLRDVLNLTGTKYGCGVAACGACSVHIDGVATRTCVLPVSAAQDKEIITIEGVADGENLSAVQKAWIAHQVPQCGYCQSGMIMAAEALLNEIPDPTDDDIDQNITNICRCGTYQRIKAAIKTAARNRSNSENVVTSSI